MEWNDIACTACSPGQGGRLEMRSNETSGASESTSQACEEWIARAEPPPDHLLLAVPPGVATQRTKNKEQRTKNKEQRTKNKEQKLPASAGYYVKHDNREEGPLTIAQLNRMKQRGVIAVDTLCRRSEDPNFRRLDELLPHLREHAPMDPEAMAKLQRDLIENEVRILTQTGFGSGALFWAPLGIGFMGAAIAVYCGFALLVKYRRPVGLAAILLGALGFWIRLARRM